MKTVNDFKNFGAFVIKDVMDGNKVLGLQINAFGERHLSKKYGRREVVGFAMEAAKDIWEAPLEPDDKTLVLYI